MLVTVKQLKNYLNDLGEEAENKVIRFYDTHNREVDIFKITELEDEVNIKLSIMKFDKIILSSEEN